MKNVLLLVHADVGQESRFQAALDLTRAVKGHLLCVEVSMPQGLPDGLCTGMDNALAAETRYTVECDYSTALKRRLEAEDVAWDWIDTTGRLPRSVVDEVGLADIVVSNLPASHLFDPSLPRVTTNWRLAHNQPVLAVPVSSRGIDWGGRALIAWDGSAAAMAALRSSVPVLALASDVELLEVDDRTSGAAAEAAAEYLFRYGIPSTVERIHSLTRPTAELIMARAEEISANYIVMGAYGHNRTRELFFGGVTRRMMQESTLPLVLAH
jgi:nucleotide-binding universal stress UspA family protein